MSLGRNVYMERLSRSELFGSMRIVFRSVIFGRRLDAELVFRVVHIWKVPSYRPHVRIILK